MKINSASQKENLDQEWHLLDNEHYGKPIEWFEKKFRFKAIEGDRLLGTIEGKVEPGVVYVSALITARDTRGKGIGTALIKKAEEFGKKYGAHRMWLVTGKEWTENAFYQKLGFEKTADLPDFYFHTDFVIYTRLIK